MKQAKRRNTRLLITCALISALISLVGFTGCDVTSTCDSCGETFSGKGYYHIFEDSDYTLCPDCAEQYYSPLPYDRFKK